MLNPTPDFREGESLLVAGIGGRYTSTTKSAIPDLWWRFVPFLGKIPNQIGGGVTYGVCFNPDGHGGFDYIAAAPVSSADDLLEGFRALTIPASRYAVFSHGLDLSTLPQTWQFAFHWLPGSSYRLADGPQFERYSADFHPEAGKGSLEVWIPVLPDGRPARAAVTS